MVTESHLVHSPNALNELRMCRKKSIFSTIPDDLITINVPLFKKLRDIIFFWWDNHFMSHFEGHFEGAKTFFAPLNCPERSEGQFRGQKSPTIV